MSKSISFAERVKELESIVEWFESDEVDLDQALAKYETGLKLTAELEDYLKTVENKVKVIKAKYKR